MNAALRHGRFEDEIGRGERETMERFAARLGAAGVNIETEGPVSSADLLHVFGTSEETFQATREALSSGIPYVITPMYWNDRYPIHFKAAEAPASPEIHQHEPDAAFFRDKMTLNKPRRREAMLEGAAAIFASGKCERLLLQRDFGTPTGKILQMPLGADLAMTAGSPDPFRQHTGIAAPFALCVGEICRRGNQHTLIEATRPLDLHAVFIGPHSEIDSEYISYCNDIAHERTHFIEEVTPQLLKSAYHAAAVCVQPALCELPGAHTLDAAASGAPLAVTERGAAWDFLGPHASYLDPEDQVSVDRALASALAAGRNGALRKHVLGMHSWGKGVLYMATIYKRLAGAVQG